MLPRNRRGGWRIGCELSTLIEMTPLEKFWPETFHYAKKHSPYYRELFRHFKKLPRLEELQTTDKKTLSERNPDFLSVPRERIAEIVTTSGTTGKPLLWMM